MCGIVGYIGCREAAEILVGALKRLEYRGYDSAGVAILRDGHLTVRKTLGKLRVLDASIQEDPIRGQTGIGHTRWATHGRPAEVNAHPHTDCSGRIALVHNGIIENYQALKAGLIAEGHRFVSQTDTEVIAHLIEKHYRGDLAQAVREAAAEMEGAFAIAAFCLDEPDRLVAARRFSPLIVARGKGEGFIGSDIPAVLEHTRDVYILNDDEMAVVTTDGISLFDMAGQPLQRDVHHVDWDWSMAEKSGFKHFMLKEIHEQPESLRSAMRGRVREDRDEVDLSEMAISQEELARCENVLITACGTAYHAGLVGKCLLENLARLRVETDLSSEFRYRNPVVAPNTLTIVISQSGETADTIAALRAAQGLGSKVISVVNAVGSTIARDSDDVLYIYAGPEIGVASTKAYTTQSLVMALLALHWGKIRGVLSDDRYRALVREIQALPQKMERILADTSSIRAAAEEYGPPHHCLYLGRGANLASAYEGALKLKEISYVHAEGYAAGEMKHGPIALIEPDCYTVAIAVAGKVYEKMISNIQEIKARDGKVIAIAFEGDDGIENHADRVLRVPRCDELLSPILIALPLQLFAYYVADFRGCDIDQPRNLAKSVTVE